MIRRAIQCTGMKTDGSSQCGRVGAWIKHSRKNGDPNILERCLHHASTKETAFLPVFADDPKGEAPATPGSGRTSRTTAAASSSATATMGGGRYPLRRSPATIVAATSLGSRRQNIPTRGRMHERSSAPPGTSAVSPAISTPFPPIEDHLFPYQSSEAGIFGADSTSSRLYQAHRGRTSFRRLSSYAENPNTTSITSNEADGRFSPLVDAAMTSHIRHNITDARVHRLGGLIEDLQARIADLEMADDMG